VGLGFLPGGNGSEAFSVTPDGAVVVGASGEAFRWTEPTGMVGLGVLPGDHLSLAHDVSSDGAVIVGTSYNPGNNVLNNHASGGRKAAVWLHLALCLDTTRASPMRPRPMARSPRPWFISQLAVADVPLPHELSLRCPNDLACGRVLAWL
jgi:hypothetical protein